MRKQLALFVAVLAASAAAGFATTAAQAAAPCDQPVYDGANLFKGDDLSKVEAAAKKLGSLGADVRALTVQSIGGASTLDNYIDAQQKSCGSWQSPQGDWKTNLLVFAVAVNERKLGIFYGDAGRWANAFGGNDGEQRIQADFMAPRFKQGEWAGGFVDGMNEAHRVLNNYLHPGSSSGPPVVVNKKPTDWGGVAKVAGIIFGSLLLIFFTIVGFVVFRQRRAAWEARQRAQQRALSARDAASSIMNAIGEGSRMAVRKAKVAKYAQAGGEYAEELSTAMSAVESNYERATSLMNAAASASAAADDKGLSVSVYEQMAERYEQILALAEEAQTADRRIDELAKEVDDKHRQMSQDIPQVQSEIDRLDASLSALKQEGIKVEPIESYLESAKTQLSQVQANSADLSSLQNLALAKEALSATDSALQNLADQRQRLTDGIPALKARIAEVRQQIEDAHDCFVRISTAYAESSWKSVRGNGSEAAKRVVSAEEALSAAGELSDHSSQEWEAALDALDKGNQLLDKAQSLLKSITEREANLHKAEQSVQQEIDAAAADIDKARQYLHTYDADIRDSLEGDLADAEKLLQEARNELSLDKPDYLKVVESATKANSAADRIYDECVEEHEAAERLRRQAVSTLNQAEAAVSQAAEFIEDHMSDVGSSAETRLSYARRELQLARQAKDPKKVLDHAASALQYGNDAYTEAEDDFDDAERRRRRRREAALAASASSYSHSHSSGSDWGSFGGGSSGGGFGSSSISFGGGGGGTGGSSSGF